MKSKKTFPRIGGKQVKSDFEYEVYKKIESMIPKGARIEYEPESFKYVIEHEYTPDIVITFKDGTKLYIEVKGNGRQFDQHVRSKMVAVKNQHPDKDIKIVFYADGRIGGVKKRKRGGYYKQSEWSKRHGYEFSIKEPKEEWFKL